MKKRVKLTEEGLIRIIRTIVEQVNLNDYDDTDFIDVFIHVFRQWLVGQIGEDIKKYPMSLLIKKFGIKFIKDYIYDGERVPEWDYDDEDTNFQLSSWDLATFGKAIVMKNKYELPGLYKEEKFTEKYAKALDRIVESLDLPPFISIKFSEDQPYRVKITVIIDFIEMIKSKEELTYGKYELQKKLENYIKNFLGVDFGNPSHGELDLDITNTEYSGSNEWIKNVLNKSLKKQIKELPEVKDKITKMGFEIRENGASLILYFKSNYWGSGGLSRYEIVGNIKKFLSEKGYGSNLKENTSY